MEVHSADLSGVIICVDPSHLAEHVYISFVNRTGGLRRQCADGLKMISWLQAKPRNTLAAQVDLERIYNLCLRRHREQQSPTQS